MDELIAEIEGRLRDLGVVYSTHVKAEPYSNGHPNSHVKLTGHLGTFYHRQVVITAVMDLLPESIHLLDEIKVK